MGKLVLLPVDPTKKHAPAPTWYVEMVERQRAFNAKHPRCIGCARFVRKGHNICADCKDW